MPNSPLHSGGNGALVTNALHEIHTVVGGRVLKNKYWEVCKDTEGPCYTTRPLITKSATTNSA